MVARYEWKSYNLQRFLSGFFDAEQFLEFERIQERTTFLIGDALAKEFVSRNRSGISMTIYCSMLFMSEVGKWLIEIGYEDGSASPGSWRRSLEIFQQGNEFHTTSPDNLGSVQSPLADLIRMQYTSKATDMNVLTHRGAYSMFPLCTLDIRPTVVMRPSNSNFPQHAICQYVRWLIDHHVNDGRPLLPSANEAFELDGPFSIFTSRSFTDRFSQMICWKDSQRRESDGIALQCFELTYSADWLMIDFNIVRYGSRNSFYCLPRHIAKMLVKEFPRKVAALDGSNDLLEQAIDRHKKLHRSNLALKPYLAVQMIIRECATSPAVLDGQQYVIDAYITETLFRAVHSIQKQVLNIHVVKVSFERDSDDRLWVFVTLRIYFFARQRPSLLCAYNKTLDKLLADRIVLLWENANADDLQYVD
ncbi:hypothetical protein GYMLUDRAFT_57626 [Collybiopsis luxurians FD-317 M1]|uniref:Uncharacterized protein n=1 Tax=Collybiopsis luxurians FD-317 M1 TaxID=944289 RepID=A0A0D0D2I1_9AGAR|nr:hypothetical protein GYMLUDRAFT_57626 [Collybiopsis luxurians FD-317 M1]